MEQQLSSVVYGPVEQERFKRNLLIANQSMRLRIDLATVHGRSRYNELLNLPTTELEAMPKWEDPKFIERSRPSWAEMQAMAAAHPRRS